MSKFAIFKILKLNVKLSYGTKEAKDSGKAQWTPRIVMTQYLFTWDSYISCRYTSWIFTIQYKSLATEIAVKHSGLKGSS